MKAENQIASIFKEVLYISVLILFLNSDGHRLYFCRNLKTTFEYLRESLPNKSNIFRAVILQFVAQSKLSRQVHSETT